MHGVVLAGGRGTRMGGEKAAAVLAGRTLLDRALAALDPACAQRAVVARADSALPGLPEGVELWIEPEGDHHPRRGLVHALRRAGAPVVALAVDLPLVPPEVVAALAGALGEGTAAVARAEGRLQPLCAAYAPAALPVLTAAAPAEPLTRTIERLAPHVVDVDPRALCNVNTPADLARAQTLLG